MAEVKHVVEKFGASAVRITWSGRGQGDTGEPVKFPLNQDRSAQVVGTFGTGGSIVIKGSNDGVNFVPLTDMRGNNLTISQARIEQIEDASYAIAPEVSGGDGTTSLTVILFARSGV